jgi:ABC-2 type transport system permease protein
LVVIDVVRAEWIKLLTVRSHWVLVIIAVLFPFVVVGLTGIFSDDFFTSGDLADLVVGTSLVSALLVGVASIVSVTAEFSFNTFRPTFAAVPRRDRVLVAKAVLNTVLAMVILAAVVTITWATGSALVEGDPELGAEGVTGQLIRLVLFAGIFALLGVGVGLLLRSTALTVTLLLLWPFVVEPLIYGLLTVMNQEDLGKWLPMRAGFAMLGTVEDDDSELLGPNAAGVYFAVFSAVMYAFGVLSAKRRDA